MECTALALAKVKLYHMMLKNVTVQLRLELHWSCTGTALEPVQHWKSCLMTSNDINFGKMHWNCIGTRGMRWFDTVPLWLHWNRWSVFYWNGALKLDGHQTKFPSSFHCTGTALELHWNCTQTSWTPEFSTGSYMMISCDNTSKRLTSIKRHWNCTAHFPLN